jgi:hypothetical protein
MNIKALLALPFCLLLSTSAWAITAGETCDFENDSDTCESGTLFICPNIDYPDEGAVQNEWYAYDCNSRYAGTSCGTLGTIDTCVAAADQQCLFQDQLIQDQQDDVPTNNGNYQFIPCSDTGTGCDAFVSGTCNSINACTPAAEGETFAPVCVANNAVYACYSNSTPVYDDCNAVEGTCDQGLYCTDVVKGGKCDGEETAQSGGPYWTCDADTKCFGYGEQSAPGYYLNEIGRCIPDRNNCGDVTYFGECLGTVALFCGDNENDPQADLVAYQCGDLNGDGEATGSCHVFDELGAYCTFREGEACVIAVEVNGQSSNKTFACHEADNPTKELFCNLDTGLCEVSSTACPDDAEYVCDGNRLNSCGEIALSWDCTSTDVSGTGCSNGACIGIPEDEGCNTTTFLCADGLYCDSETNSCKVGEAPIVADAGVETTEDTDAGSTSNTNVDAGIDDEPTSSDAGTTDGSADGSTNGSTDGSTDGSTNGSTNGSTDGSTDGTTDGSTDGSAVDAGSEEDIDMGTRADPPGLATSEEGCGCQSHSSSKHPLNAFWGLLIGLPFILRRKSA